MLGKNGLMFACQNGHLKIVQYLIEKNIFDLSLQSKEDGYTFFKYTVQSGK